MKFDERTKKLMSEFFYDCHQKLWDRIIKEMEWRPGVSVSSIKSGILNKKLIGGIEGCQTCYGCTFTSSCKHCFLKLDCRWTCSWYVVADENWAFPFNIRLDAAKKIRNCGWRYVDDDKVYEKMFQMIIDMTTE